MSRLEEQIRAAARRMGFELCGFAPVHTPAHAAFVRQWVDSGYAASMTYIARGLAKRLDPCLIVPEARTVISLGYRYRPPPVPPLDWQRQLRGRIAAYALGTDYHATLERKLRQLAAFVGGQRRDAVVRPYVDTGPVLEREWAASAGLGWFGKNTNILHTEHGSYFFLAELLTNLELEPEASIPDHCGTCTRCLDLCPTAALAPGYVLDARRCISYWTIEHRGTIPRALRATLGNWIFGCDICQEVCPWNEKLVQRAPSSDTGALLPYLPDLLSLDEDAFRRRFGDSAIRRAKREGLLRNVAIVLGNARNPAAVGVLTQALRRDHSALVRAHTAWALGAIGGRTARQALAAALRREPDDTVRCEIKSALDSDPSASV